MISLLAGVHIILPRLRVRNLKCISPSSKIFWSLSKRGSIRSMSAIMIPNNNSNLRWKSSKIFVPSWMTRMNKKQFWSKMLYANQMKNLLWLLASTRKNWPWVLQRNKKMLTIFLWMKFWRIKSSLWTSLGQWAPPTCSHHIITSKLIQHSWCRYH